MMKNLFKILTLSFFVSFSFSDIIKTQIEFSDLESVEIKHISNGKIYYMKKKSNDKRLVFGGGLIILSGLLNMYISSYTLSSDSDSTLDTVGDVESELDKLKGLSVMSNLMLSMGGFFVLINGIYDSIDCSEVVELLDDHGNSIDFNCQ